eukprot:4648139-Pyramimonas_sp.AAC.1
MSGAEIALWQKAVINAVQSKITEFGIQFYGMHEIPVSLDEQLEKELGELLPDDACGCSADSIVPAEP